MTSLSTAANAHDQLSELIDMFDENSKEIADKKVNMLAGLPNRYWLEESVLPEPISDSQLCAIDDCSFIIFHVAKGDNERRHLNSYICHPFKKEYKQLELVNDKFPDNMFDGDNCHHEKIFDVSHLYHDEKNTNIRHYVDIGCNHWAPWVEEHDDVYINLEGTKAGNYIYKIIVDLKSLTVEYINLLNIENSPITKENDLKMITTLNGHHSVRLSESIFLITGGWDGDTDLILFDASTYEYKRFENTIPYTVNEDDRYSSQGLARRNGNQFILWNGLECFLMTLVVKTKQIKSIHDEIKFVFKKTEFLPFEKGVCEQYQFCSFVKYKDFIICVGELEDEGDEGEWRQHDRVYICYTKPKLPMWILLKNIKTPTVLSANSSILSVDPSNGDIVLNVIGGVKWVDTDHERLDIDLTNHQKLCLGIDDKMRRRIWNQLIAHQSLPVNLWAIVFDMIDGGILAQFDKPYA